MDSTTVNKIIGSARFKKTFGSLQGEELKTAPKGFSKEDPNIYLIRKKQFYAFREFSDKEVLSKDFVSKTVETFRAIRPYFDYMSEVLTTNLNGEPI